MSRLPAYQDDYLGQVDARMTMGMIADEPTVKGRTIRFPLDVQQISTDSSVARAQGRVMVSIERRQGDPLHLRYGDRIAFAGLLREIPPAYNPGQFDYKRYSAHKNIYYQVYLGQDDFVLLGRGHGNPVIAQSLHLREKLQHKFKAVIAYPETLAIAAALVFGYRAQMNDDTVSTFAETGTIHVLSVSGMHVGIVFYILNIVFGFLDKLRYGRPIRFVSVLLCIWCYVLLTGMAPSILRSGLMISFVLFAGWGNRTYGNLNSLLASACFILFFDPLLIFDVGFQLSYAAVFGLFTVHPLLSGVINVKNRLLRAVWLSISVSISAQLFTTPLVLYYFHQFPTYFLLGNLLIAIPSTLLMYAGLLLMISPLRILDIFLGKCIFYISSWMIDGLQHIQRLPKALFSGLQFSGIEVLLATGVLLMLLLFCKIRSKWALYMAALMLLPLLLFSARGQLVRSSFRGIKVYNVYRDVAIAVIDGPRVYVYSNLDSLDHPRLAMAIQPDLMGYAERENIAFCRLPLRARRDIYIETTMGRIAIIDRNLSTEMLPEPAQWVIMRGVRAWDKVSFAPINRNTYFIFDGSNAASAVAAYETAMDSLGIAHYTLKDNFAYVWAKPIEK